MLQDFAFIGLMAVVALIIPVVALVGQRLLSPHRPGRIKQSVYESGMTVTGDSWIQFRVQYYLYALVFVIFDIEAVFLYPWAVSYGVLGWFALFEMFVFIAILAIGLVYAWRKGALEWV